MTGTTIEATVKRVVDGDTVYVEEFPKSIRILSLDTEESHSGGGKPTTPWGLEASEYAKQLLEVGSRIRLEFQGTEDPSDVWSHYVDNFGRGLAWVHLEDGRDFQELMIRQGYSPYFTKYGYAEWPRLHSRYVSAEREAQLANLGVWDQVAVNGSMQRNYAVLGVWWDLRARLIEEYRSFKLSHPSKPVFNTRKDYLQLKEMAGNNEEVIVFSELRSYRRVGGVHGLISIGSQEQSFDFFIPQIDSQVGQQIVTLLANRYFPREDERFPRRGYAYVKGKLQLYRNERMQMVIESANAFFDGPNELD